MEFDVRFVFVSSCGLSILRHKVLLEVRRAYTSQNSGVDFTSAGALIWLRREKWLKVVIAVTIF